MSEQSAATAPTLGDAALATAGRGAGGAVAVVGPPSAVAPLLEAIGATLAARGATVVRGRGVAAERTLALAGLHDLLEPLLAHVDALVPARRRALDAALGRGDGSDRPDALTCGLATRDLLRAAGATTPVGLVVERADLLDGASLEVLAYVARRAEGSGTTLVLGWDDDAGPPPEAVPVLEVATPPPPSARAARATTAIRAGDGARALELTEGAEDAPRAERALLLALRGGALVLTGDATAGSTLLHAPGGLVRAAAPDPAALDALAVVALALVWVEDYDDARAVVDRILAATEDGSSPDARAGALVVTAVIDFGLGDWDASIAAAAEAMGASSPGPRGWRPAACASAALVAACRGDDEARALATRALAEATAPGDPARQTARAALAELHLLAGRPQEALDAVAPLAGGPTGQNPAPALWEACLVEALAAVGRAEEARSVLDDLERRAHRAGHDRGISLAARVRAGLGDGADDDVDAALGDALARVSDPPLPWPMARLRLVWGRRLLEGGRRVDATVQLRAAEQLFANLAAPGWQQRAADLLARATDDAPQHPDRGTTRIHLLGRLDVEVDGAPPAPLPVGRVTAALEIVVAEGGRIHADQVVEHLWPDVAPTLGRARLRNLLKRTRSLLGEVIVRQGSVLALAPGVSVDVLELQGAGRRALGAERRDPAEADRLALAALRHDDGDFALDNLYEPWAAAPREALRRLRLDLLDLRARVALDQGRPDDAEALVHRAVDLDPLDEDRCLDMAARLLDGGRRSSARALLDRAREASRRLDLPPSPAAEALEARLRG